MDSQFLMRIILYAAVALTVITVATGGALGDAVMEGFSQSEKQTDYRLDIANKPKLSNAALYVYHRANDGGCKDKGEGGVSVPNQNQGEINNFEHGLTGERWYTADYDGGYPALADTYIGLKPGCTAGASTPLGGGIESLSPTTGVGGDQEGVYSRVSFEIQEKIVLDAQNPNSWLEHNLRGALRGGSIYEKIAPTCKGFYDDWAPGYEASYDTLQNFPEYLLFFVPEVPDSRSTDWVENHMDTPPVFCHNCAGIGCLKAPVDQNVPYDNFQVTLCPGDRGYIQMNKAKFQGPVGPKNKGEATEQATDGSTEKYAFIQINSVEQETC